MWVESVFSNKVAASLLALYLDTPSVVQLYSTCTKLRALFYDANGWGLNVLGLNARWIAQFKAANHWKLFLGIIPHQAPSRFSTHGLNFTNKRERPKEVPTLDNIPHLFAWMNSNPAFCRGGCGCEFDEFLIPLSARRYPCCTACFNRLGQYYHLNESSVKYVLTDLHDRNCIENGFVSKKQVAISVDRLLNGHKM